MARGEEMNTLVEISDNIINCAIITEKKGCQFAFYININGVEREKIWYTLDNSTQYDLGEEIIHFVVITSFIRELDGTIHTQVTSKKSDWSVCDGVIAAAKMLTNSDSTILEFGSGYGSKELSEHCSIYSIEHDEKFTGLFEKINYIYAPLKKQKLIDEFNEEYWYDFEIIQNSMPSEIDLILLDGPPADIGRSGLLHHLDNFNDGIIWIIDDVLRVADQKISNYISIKFSLIQYRFWNFSILSKVAINQKVIKKIHEASLRVFNGQSKNYLKHYYPSVDY
jgi:hypothetical protein